MTVAAPVRELVNCFGRVEELLLRVVTPLWKLA
jgi:hypothetical protein